MDGRGEEEKESCKKDSEQERLKTFVRNHQRHTKTEN